MSKQTYPYWRHFKDGGWGFFTRPRHYSATCMQTWNGKWGVPYLDYTSFFDRLEDAKAFVEKHQKDLVC